MALNRSTDQVDVISHHETVSVPLPILGGVVDDPNINFDISLKFCGLFAQTSVYNEKATAFARLLTSAVDAEPESYQQENTSSLAAIAILKKHPELLFKKGIVTDHFGRNIWGSTYQLFLGTGDTWALKQVHDIILPMIQNGDAQAIIHFQRQFPNCPLPYKRDLPEETLYDERNRKQVAEIIEQLNLIAASINDDPCTNGRATLPATTQAVVALRQIFAPKEDEVIRSGLHFPFAIMKEIYRVYKNRFDHWQRSDRLAFYSREVIGAAEAALSAVDSQCCKNGIGIFDLVKGPDRTDSLFCRHPRRILQELTPKNVTGKYAVLWFEHHMNTRNNQLWEILCGHTKAAQPRQNRP